MTKRKAKKPPIDVGWVMPIETKQKTKKMLADMESMTLTYSCEKYKLYSYTISGEHTTDTIRYELTHFANGTFLLVKLKTETPVATYSGLDIDKFKLEEHL